MKRRLFHIVMGQLLLMFVFTSVVYAEFGLLLACFRSKDDAENYATKIVKSLAEAPYPAFVEKTEVQGEGFWYRVCMGPFADRKEALSSKQLLKSKNIAKDVIIVETKADAGAVAGTTTPQKIIDSSPLLARGLTRQGPVSVGKKESIITKKTKDITLTWDAQKDPAPGGYKIYYDTKSGPPYKPDPADYVIEGPPPIVVKGDVTEITLHGLTNHKDYFFVVVAFDSLEGTESPFSKEIVAPSETPLPAGTAGAALPKKVDESGGQVDQPEVENDQPMAPGFSEDELRVLREAKMDVMTPAGLDRESEDDSLIAAGDTLDIVVPGQAEMSILYDVAPDGNIYMVSIGRVSVQGVSPANLESSLMTALKRFMEKGQKISVNLLKRERYIHILGGVRYPGWYRVPMVVTLKELVETAGGLLEGAADVGTKLGRETADGYREIPIGKGRIVLRPNDILTVPAPEVYHKKVDSGDLLFINVPGRVEGRDQFLQERIYKLNQFEVDNNGYVYVPDVGHIYVNGLTTPQIREAISKMLPKYLARDAKMDVGIIEKRQYVEVLGHVANPGVYVVREGSNVQAALNIAGGAVDGAVMSDARILRKRGGETERIKINLYQFTITGDPRLLTPLHENDTLFVPISPNFGNIKRTLMPWTPPPEKLEEDAKNKVRIFGAVKDPGTYEPKEGMTLVDLMIAAGGEVDVADLSKVLIIRKGVIDKTFNLRLFFNGESKEPLPDIKNGDTVYVNFKELKIFEPEEEKVFYVLGEVKNPDQYKLADNMTLYQAISLAGGFTEWADMEHITIVRLVNGKQQNITYSFENGIAGRAPEWNTYIYPGDTIYVP